MRKIYLSLFFVLFAIVTQAQISVTATAGTTSASYTTLKEAFDAINLGTHQGAINLSVTASTTETATALLNVSGGTSNYTSVMIKPAASTTPTITGSVASAPLIRILGSNVTIDGTNGSGTSRDLTISNTSTTAPQVIQMGSVTSGSPLMNVTIKNSVLINGVNTSSAVVINDGVAAAAGYFKNITFQNNSVQKAYIGVYFLAVIGATNGSGSVATGNDLSTSGTNAIRLVGIYMQGLDGGTVSNNTIGNFETTNAEIKRAVWFATGTVNSSITGNNISALGYTGTSTTAAGTFAITVTSGNTGANAVANILVERNTLSNLFSSGTSYPTGIYIAGTLTNGVTVNRNTITNVKNSNTGGYGANGIVLASTSTAANTVVSNNLISDVAGHGYITSAGVNDNGYGITMASGGGYSLYYNTVLLNTNQTVDGLPAAVNVTSAITTAGSIDIRNNIFINTQTTGTNRYAIYSGAANTVFSNIDYNNYNTAGPNLGYVGSNRATLTDIQTGFGGNTNSKAVSVTFVNAATGDLHLTGGSNGDINLKGTPVSVTTDFDGQTRSSLNPYMGGDEASVPLPVQLISFTGKKDGKANLLHWSTSLESNNKGFELERSADGKNFSAISFINTKAEGGSSNSTLNYSFIDERAGNATAYYRLKQIDMDGKTAYSSLIVMIKGDKYGFEIASVYPNPAREKVNLVITTGINEKANIVVTDINGRAVKQMNIGLNAGDNYINIDINSLAPGSYFIRLTNSRSEIKTAQFIKN